MLSGNRGTLQLGFLSRSFLYREQRRENIVNGNQEKKII